MITMQMTPEQGKALLRLIETAERKGRASDWWRCLVRPLTAETEGGGSNFHQDLGRAVVP